VRRLTSTGTNAHCVIEDFHQHGFQYTIDTRSIKALALGTGIAATVTAADAADETHQHRHENASGPQQAPQILVWSSPEQGAVDRLSIEYAEYLGSRAGTYKHEQVNISDLAFTLSERRSVFQWRTAVVYKDFETSESALRKPAKIVRAVNAPALLFVFTGQGAQHYAMGRALLRHGAFAESMNAAERYFVGILHSGWSVLEELTRPKLDSKISQARFAQPLCTAIQVALVDLLRSWGVTPTTVIGHSSGEIGTWLERKAFDEHDANIHISRCLCVWGSLCRRCMDNSVPQRPSF